MSKKLEGLEKKAREAKTANGMVSAVRKYVAAGGSAEKVEDIIRSTKFSLQCGHLLSLLFFHSHANGSMSDFGDKLCGRILESADFFQRITLAAIVSEFKDRQLGAAISEDAFSDIEGTDDYLFHAVSGVKEVVSNQSLDAVNGYGSALMTVGDKEYKLSTIDSIHEDLVAMRGSITPKDFGEHLITLSRCYYLSDEAGRGSELYRGAIEELSQSDGVISLFHQIGIIFVPGKTVHDSASESKFPDEEVIELLRETAKKRLTGDDQEYALSCLDF